MHVAIVSCFPKSLYNSIADEAREWVSRCGSDTWTLVTSPAEAVMTLFLEQHSHDDPLFLQVWGEARQARRNRRKAVFLYHDVDTAFPLVAGLYPSLERRFHVAGICETWCYVTQLRENRGIQYTSPTGDERYLYSFVGNVMTHPVRRRIVALRDGRALLHASESYIGDDLLTPKVEYFDCFSEAIRDSKFVLCPRGISPTSYRLLEAMKAGRVPVIVSDAWPLPHGPAWSEFSLVIPEARVDEIPSRVREVEAQSAAMGRAARNAWENWYSRDARFARMLERFADLARNESRQTIKVGRVFRAIFSSRVGFTMLRKSLGHYKRHLACAAATNAETRC